MSHNSEGKIVDVYEDNLEEQLKRIANLVEEYNFISMDTEFPGIVFPLSQSSQYTSKNLEHLNVNLNLLKSEKQNTSSDSNYKNIKSNVDNLKMIQLGITLANENGEFPEDVSTWQFNFKFDLEHDAYLNESINLLEMAGIDFKKFSEKGININTFAELFTTSGLVLNDNVKWITFHGSYDFAYLIKALANQPLPEDENALNEMLGLYFCNFYDVRHIIRNIAWLKGSLSRISTDLDLKRVGQTHQAGSDSLITSKVFFKLLSSFNDHVDLFSDHNKLFGFSYKMIEDYDWGNNTYGNGFSAYPHMGMTGPMNAHPQMHHMNPMMNPRLNINGVNKPSAQNTMPNMNMIYFQNMNNITGYPSNINNMNNLNSMNTLNMFYGNANMNGMNNFNYQQGMDYNNFYGGFYNNMGNNTSNTSSNNQPLNLKN